MKNSKKENNEDKSKAKLDLSDDDDDYTFEDIYKAADKNVLESEKAKKEHIRRGQSLSHQYRGRVQDHALGRLGHDHLLIKNQNTQNPAILMLY